MRKVIMGGRNEVVATALEMAEMAATIASKSSIAEVGTKHLLLHS